MLRATEMDFWRRTARISQIQSIANKVVREIMKIIHAIRNKQHLVRPCPTKWITVDFLSRLLTGSHGVKVGLVNHEKGGERQNRQINERKRTNYKIYATTGVCRDWKSGNAGSI